MITSTRCYFVICDGDSCDEQLTDYETEAPILFVSQSSADEFVEACGDWTGVQELAFCPATACQEQAQRERVARADRLPVPVLPGQISIEGLVAK